MTQLDQIIGVRQAAADLGARPPATPRPPLPSVEPASEELIAPQASRTLEAAEEACRRGEDLLRAIIDSSKAVVYLKDVEGRYRLINQQWADLFGVTKESILGKTDHDIFPAEIADRFRANDVGILAARHAVELEELAPHVDGIHTYISMKVPLTDSEGVPCAICGISTDITERKRMEEALRLGEERFRGAFEAVATGMALVDPDGRWMRVNPALCEIVGYTEGELLASTFQSITHPEDLATDLELMRRALAGEIGSFQREKRFVHKWGEAVWTRISVSVVRDLGGQPLHLVAQVEDVTPRRQAEELVGALYSELHGAYDATIAGWARALDLRDHETEGHSRRVTEVTLRLARSLGMSESELIHVRRGALLHDIGKMGVPDAILLKPGPLTEQEWPIMRRHPDLAAEMLAPIAFLQPALDIPHCHHEKWDGTGYPRGVAGEKIPMAARVFAVVDIWDAPTHDRPYRSAWPEDRVRDHLRLLAGTHLDPAIVSAFLSLPEHDQAEAEAEAEADESPMSVVDDSRNAQGPRPDPEGLDIDPVMNPERLAALRDTGLLDSPVEHEMDRQVRLASKVLQAPMAVIALVDDHRLFFKSSWGLPEPYVPLREAPASQTFCQEVVRSGAPPVVSDARLDPRFRETPGVSQKGVVAFVGMPLATSSGHVLGTFFAFDFQPRQWAEDELEILRDLAGSVMREIELREDITARKRVEDELRRSQRRLAEQLCIATELNGELKRQLREMAHANDRLAEMAATDSLTGLKNRRHFAGALPDAYTLSRREGTPLSVILVDVDEFKRYNDSFGHPAGDYVLRAVAPALAGQMRSHDLVARYGGEEFVILLPKTGEVEAEGVAERLRVAVEARAWPNRSITASFGVATSDGTTEGPWEIVDQADHALYLSKRGGRNRVTHHRRRQALFLKSGSPLEVHPPTRTRYQASCAECFGSAD